MNEWIVQHEPWLRLGAFGAVLLALLVAQDLWPRRGAPPLRALRWTANLSVVIVNVLLVRLLIPLGATGTAIWADVLGYGLLNHLDMPRTLEEGLAFVALDCVVYWQHRLFHRMPWF